MFDFVQFDLVQKLAKPPPDMHVYLAEFSQVYMWYIVTAAFAALVVLQLIHVDELTQSNGRFFCLVYFDQQNSLLAAADQLLSSPCSTMFCIN
jgi:hypothetical protein